MKLPCAVVLGLSWRLQGPSYLPVALYLTVLVVQTQLLCTQAVVAASVMIQMTGPLQWVGSSWRYPGIKQVAGAADARLAEENSKKLQMW